MKILPKHICAHPDGFLVRVYRGQVLFQAFVPASQPAPLARCLELRDRFLRLAAKLKIPRVRTHRDARSNTGVVGVSETVKFNGVRAYPCFNVSWSVRGRQRMKRFVFGGGADRSRVLQNAINHRQQMTEVVYE